MKKMIENVYTLEIYIILKKLYISIMNFYDFSMKKNVILLKNFIIWKSIIFKKMSIFIILFFMIFNEKNKYLIENIYYYEIYII